MIRIDSPLQCGVAPRSDTNRYEPRESERCSELESQLADVRCVNRYETVGGAPNEIYEILWNHFSASFASARSPLFAFAKSSHVFTKHACFGHLWTCRQQVSTAKAEAQEAVENGEKTIGSHPIPSGFPGTCCSKASCGRACTRGYSSYSSTILTWSWELFKIIFDLGLVSHKNYLIYRFIWCKKCFHYQPLSIVVWSFIKCPLSISCHLLPDPFGPCQATEVASLQLSLAHAADEAGDLTLQSWQICKVCPAGFVIIITYSFHIHTYSMLIYVNAIIPMNLPIMFWYPYNSVKRERSQWDPLQAARASASLAEARQSKLLCTCNKCRIRRYR